MIFRALLLIERVTLIISNSEAFSSKFRARSEPKTLFIIFFFYLELYKVDITFVTAKMNTNEINGLKSHTQRGNIDSDRNNMISTYQKSDTQFLIG